MANINTIRRLLSNSPAAYHVGRLVYRSSLKIFGQRSRRPMNETNGPGSIIVTDLKVLDQLLENIEEQNKNDHARLRTELAKIWFQNSEVTEFKMMDPFSAAYREKMVSLQARLYGRTYSTDREGFVQEDIPHRVRWQTPYGQPPSILGGYLISYGFLIKTMDLPVGSRILEVGSGEGGLSYQFAKAGYNLTCVEVSPSFAKITERSLAGLECDSVEIKVLNSNIMTAQLDDRFDAIVFYESFHHIPDHFQLLQLLKHKLAPTGMFVFAAEPIVDQQNSIVPYPWGLRFDGESLRAIRNFGWMELGFTWAYFDEVIKRIGFKIERFRSADSHWADVVIARKSDKEQPCH